MTLKTLKRENAPNLAYRECIGDFDQPTIMFLGGFCSDMMGSKASFLEQKCRERKQNYIRFDYSGHGESQGQFEQGCISDWTQDAQDILDHCVTDKVILIGSSMGGWISLLLALKNVKRVQALIGIAAAPDFTLWMEEGMSEDQRSAFDENGFFELPSDYDAPYIITKKLIEDGRSNFLLEGPIDLQIPVRLLQGKKDQSVPWKTAERIKKAITGVDVEIIYQEKGDHSLSSSEDLKVLDDVMRKLL